jgi:hypothetical protein
MSNRTFGFGGIVHPIIIALIGFMIWQLVARLVWALLIVGVGWLLTIQGTGLSSVRFDGFWHVFAAYTSDPAVFVVTQALGALVAAVLILQYLKHVKRRTAE